MSDLIILTKCNSHHIDGKDLWHISESEINYIKEILKRTKKEDELGLSHWRELESKTFDKSMPLTRAALNFSQRELLNMGQLDELFAKLIKEARK
jgi:hypothetical protein